MFKKNIKNVYKNRKYYMKLLKFRNLVNFEEILLKILEEILSCEEFLKYRYDNLMKFEIIFDAIKWDLN